MSKTEWNSDWDAIFESYVECALWSSTDNTTESGGYPLDDNYSEDDLDETAVEAMKNDIASFMFLISEHELGDELRKEWEDEELGHDLWLTRNGHGAGFWDRGKEHGDTLSELAKSLGSQDIIVGDDGLLYVG